MSIQSSLFVVSNTFQLIINFCFTGLQNFFYLFFQLISSKLQWRFKVLCPNQEFFFLWQQPLSHTDVKQTWLWKVTWNTATVSSIKLSLWDCNWPDNPDWFYLSSRWQFVLSTYGRHNCFVHVVLYLRKISSCYQSASLKLWDHTAKLIRDTTVLVH